MSQTAAPRVKIGWRTSIPYGVGAIASAAKTVPITTFLMLYYNEVLRVPAISVSAVLMVSLMLDAVFDPVMGHVSDHFRSRWGRRLPFMYASAVPVTILFIMLWIPPSGWSTAALTGWLAFCVIGVRLFDSVFYLPHVAMIPELTSEYHERTKLFTVRYIFEAAGGAVVGLLAYTYFMKERPDGTGGLLSPAGYPAFAWFTGSLIFLTILACCMGLQARLGAAKPPPPPRDRTAGGMFREMAATLRSKPFAALVATGFFVAIGSGIGSSLSLYWTMYAYQFTQVQISLLIPPVMLGTFATGIVPLISRRMGKRNAAILLCWVYALSASMPLVIRAFDLIPAKSPALFALVIVQTAVAPAAITMVMILLGSMVADLVEDAEVRTGRRSEGLLLSVNSLVRKATQGLGTLGAGVLLTLVHFPRGAERHQVAPVVLTHLILLYLAVTVALFIGTTLALLAYRHNRSEHEANLRKLSDLRRSRRPSDAASVAASEGEYDPEAEMALIALRLESENGAGSAAQETHR